MKKRIINHWMNIIKKNKTYSNEKLTEIEYGLTGLYLTLSKLVVIIILALLLGIFKEMIILLFLFNIIRISAFGLHAKKSWICLVSSIIFFILIPLIIKNIIIPSQLKILIGIINIVFIYIFSPADTKKRPIINKKRRFIYKIISTFTAIALTTLSFIFNDNYIQNCCVFALIIENILISPITYKIFKEPYNNYKNYTKKSIS